MLLKRYSNHTFDEYTTPLEQKYNNHTPETASVHQLKDLVELMEYDIKMEGHNIDNNENNRPSNVPVFISVDNNMYLLESYTKTFINGKLCMIINTYNDIKLIKK